MMKFLLYSTVLLVFGFHTTRADNGNKVSQINTLKKQAEQAFQKQDYQTSATLYQTLLDQYGVSDASLRLNLAHAYFKLGDTENAHKYYQSVASEQDKDLASRANQQLAVLEKENTERALQYCKKALQLNPANEEARFNYELLKKKANQEKNQQNKDKNNNKDKQNDQQNQQNNQDKQDKSQQSQQKEQQQNQQDKKDEKSDSGNADKEQQKQDEKDQQGKESKEEKDRKDKQQQEAERQQRLQNINMNEEKARMILDALKNNEVQYYQQYNRKPTKKMDKSKPDW